MITYEIESLDYASGTAKFSFEGLSTDTKPTVKHEGYSIANGSTFLIMDEQDLKFYNKDTEDWV